MRILSRAEAVAVLRLLAQVDLGSGNGMGGDPIPRRTAQAIRQRAYLRGWLEDRYVPNPAMLGFPMATFLLARPFSEKARQAAAVWRAQPGNVLLWSSPELLFGVFLLERREGIQPLTRELGEEGLTRLEAVLAADATEPSIPVYFDFEAAWSGWNGLLGTLTYPHPLPSGIAEGHTVGVARWPPRAQAALSGLLLSPIFGPGTGPPRARLSRHSLAERRWLRNGTLELRSFLNPREVGRWITGFADQVVFVHGTLLPGAQAPALFRALVGGCKVGPFLFVTDRRTVLFGALSCSPERRPKGAPSPRAPVLPTLQRYLGGIGIVRESLASLEVLVDHRYERLLLEATPA